MTNSIDDVGVERPPNDVDSPMESMIDWVRISCDHANNCVELSLHSQTPACTSTVLLLHSGATVLELNVANAFIRESNPVPTMVSDNALGSRTQPTNDVALVELQLFKMFMDRMAGLTAKLMAKRRSRGRAPLIVRTSKLIFKFDADGESEPASMVQIKHDEEMIMAELQPTRIDADAK